MAYKLIIEPVDNGFILTQMENNSNACLERYVFQEYISQLEPVRDLLQSVQDLLGYAGSKHDLERIFVEIRKQDNG